MAQIYITEQTDLSQVRGVPQILSEANLSMRSTVKSPESANINRSLVTLTIAVSAL